MRVSFGWWRDAFDPPSGGHGPHRASSRAVRVGLWFFVASLLAGALVISPWGAAHAGRFAGRVEAASSPGLSLTPTAGALPTGATLDLDIVADCGAHADAVAITLSFDPTRLQVVSVTPDTSRFPDTLLAASYDNNAGLVRYEAGSLACHSTGSCPSGSVHLAAIRFSAIGQCSPSVPLALTGQLTWEGSYVFDGSGDGSTITITIAGDVNVDGRVNVQDIQLVAAHWSSEQGEALYDPRYDLDADGDIDVADIMYVAARWNRQCGG